MRILYMYTQRHEFVEIDFALHALVTHLISLMTYSKCVVDKLVEAARALAKEVGVYIPNFSNYFIAYFQQLNFKFSL